MSEQTTALVKVEPKDDFLPIMTVQDALQRREAVKAYTNAILVEGDDYGVIPGTDKKQDGKSKAKKTLFKPGAEKLCTVFGLAPHFDIIRSIEDWNGTDHDGEPFFYYLVKCRLYRGERILAEGDGSCNSWESRYRYRNGERKCPNCGKAAIIKGKAEYGGGWLCFDKKGGCKSKFPEGDASIEGQQVGKVKNPDVADLVNTILKMSEKRALIAATLIATNASDSFTQDVEDHGGSIIDAEYEVAPPRREPERSRQELPRPANGNAKQQPQRRPSDPPSDGIELEQRLAVWDERGAKAGFFQPGELTQLVVDFAREEHGVDGPMANWPANVVQAAWAELNRLAASKKKQPAHSAN